MIPPPLDADELRSAFRAEMTALCPSPPARVAVAVSGGSDSMALALLATDWAKAAGSSLLALTVDHGLRPESADEAKQVGDWLAAAGIETESLTWQGPPPQSGVQQAAREARYALMTAECRARGISHLLLGHQLEDQLETFLMRLSKGSGLDGLAAMETVREQAGVQLLRPLLGVPRESLRRFLQSSGQGWIDDPGNENPRYTRTRVGAVLRELQGLPGSSREAIALAHKRLQRANDSLEQIVRHLLLTEVEVDPFGTLRIADRLLRAQPEEIALRLIAASLRAVGGGGHIRLQSVEEIQARLMTGGTADKDGSATLGGAQLLRNGNYRVFCREAGRGGLPELALRNGEESWIWDNRFIVRDLSPDAERPDDISLRALGPSGARMALDRGMLPSRPRMTARQRGSLPGLWQGAALLAVPLPEGYSGRESSENPRFRLTFRAFYWIPRPNSC